MSKNNIITIAQRVQQSPLAKSAFKELRHIASKMNTDVSELWSNVPSLKADDFIDISNLRIDTNIQRDPFRGGRVKGLEKTLKNWDSRQFGRIKIAKKTGRRWRRIFGMDLNKANELGTPEWYQMIDYVNDYSLGQDSSEIGQGVSPDALYDFASRLMTDKELFEQFSWDK